MSDPACESAFFLEIAGLPEPLAVAAFTGSEAISEPFVYEAQVLLHDTSLDLAGLLYRNVWLSFGASGRGVHGQLHELVEQPHGTGCRVRIGPKLACLAQRFSQRVFGARSVPQIIRQVLKEHGISGRHLCLDLGGDYPPQDFCTQYRETDLHFLQRVCAQAGIHFHFEQARDGHCLVFADNAGSFPLADEAEYGDHRPSPGVRAFSVQTNASGARVAEGRSDLMNLHAGRVLALSAHPLESWNRRWLLTCIERHGQAGVYGNRFKAIPLGAPFATANVPAKPRMASRQRGWVVAVDEPAAQDAGRVAVQFDWVYQGEGASPSHCWLPLAPELLAGAAALDEGTEVLVSFIEGDPDRPLISAFLDVPASLDLPEAPAASPALPERRCPADPDPVLLSAIRNAEPLVLLCLLPGGGSFSHCAEPLCTCRLLMQPGAGVAP
ncbi:MULTISPECIES: type VI secretion system Vgr family protein [Pseudomonas]|uniref:type VI secretion system Vgr family protein n=1 Tax=Pseudomonas TaxID=286 RepID=UPI001BE6A034|nr:MULTISPECIES: contractile injection system protein, VgrG/Pvc8 family [Pseudomonas]MBT2341229.1 type VI secretion protein [Pseudomonas fluorescens]MCD4529945.1 phage baseplate assembly protein V [Pseudomonas sp. C3-2018]